MVFSSVPVYLDPPNWHQHQHPNLYQGSGSFDNHQNPQLPPPLPPSPHGSGGGSASSIRPGSMADRARLAKIPQPEVALKCPRCESTNTKFCYFNNYSLSQPRHFCKTCRRYWTRGGALRNVPVGGGCRRNKKNKSSSSKSTTSTEKQAHSNSSTSVSPSENIIGLPQPPPQTSFLSSLQNLTQYNNLGNIGVNFGGIQAQMGETSGANQSTDHMGFQNNSGGGLDQWRSQQFPFLASGFESQTGFYSLQSDGIGGGGSSMVGNGENQLRYLMPNFRVSQMAPVKMEENQGLNSSRQVLGVSENNQFWGGNMWTDLSGLNSSSTSHLL